LNVSKVSWRTTNSVAFALFAIALLALWTRVQYVELYGSRAVSYNVWASEHYFGGLSEFYLSTAETLAAGGTYTSLHHPPGYSYLLALLKAIGPRSVRAIRITQSILDAAVVFVVYRLARGLGVTTLWALAASAAYTVWPLFAAGSTWPLAESLSVPLLAVLLALLVWAGRANAAVLAAAICGVAIGAAALVRPDLVLLCVPGAVWLAVRSRKAWGPFALLVACALPIGLWGVHNRITNGVWVFGSTSSGLGLWEGLGESPNNYGYELDDSAANHRLMSKGLTWASVEADRYFRQEYLHAWRDHPQFVARVIAARIPRILFGSEHLQPLFFARARQAMDALGIILVLAAVWIRRRDPSAWLVLLLPPLYAIASIGLVHYEPRYVRYVQLSYLLGAVVLADEAWRRLTLHRKTFAFAAAGVVIVLAGAYTFRELYALHTAAVAGVAVP
jgi:hypothetical protein